MASISVPGHKGWIKAGWVLRMLINAARQEFSDDPELAQELNGDEVMKTLPFELMDPRVAERAAVVVRAGAARLAGELQAQPGADDVDRRVAETMREIQLALEDAYHLDPLESQ
jgi:hypothetical protein